MPHNSTFCLPKSRHEMDSHDNWDQEEEYKTKKLVILSYFTAPFHILTTTLLGLLLPLSFLLLARLSSYSYFTTTSASPNPSSPPSNFLILWPFTCINVPILYSVVSILSGATLVHGLIRRSSSTAPIYRPKLYVAWTLLCTLQVCVGLGIEGTIGAGIDGYRFNSGYVGGGVGLFSRVIFFLGLHETMMDWTRTVVRPVVDDTVFGEERGERRLQKVAAAACLGGLWWWRLKEEVEWLVLVADTKKELTLRLNLGDLLGWWLYYVTVTIGMVRIVKVVLWVGSIFLLRRTGVEEHENFDGIPGTEDKV